MSSPNLKGRYSVEKEVFLDKLKKLVALGKSKQNALDATEINDFLPEITSDRSRWTKFIIT